MVAIPPVRVSGTWENIEMFAEQKAAAADGQPVVEKDAAPPIAEPNLRPLLKKVVKNFDEAGAAQRVLETYGDRIRWSIRPHHLTKNRHESRQIHAQ